MATKTFRWVGPVAEEDICATLFGGKSTNIGTAQGQEVVDYLEDNDSNEAHIILSSNGGSAFIATRLVDMLSAYKQRITMEINGMAASAGSLLAAGIPRELYARKSSTMLIHGPQGGAIGTKKIMRKEGILLEKLEAVLTDVYTAGSDLTPKELEEAYDTELVLTSKEMKQRGIVTKIMKDNEKVAALVKEGRSKEEIVKNDSNNKNLTLKYIQRLAAYDMDRIAAVLNYNDNDPTNTEDTEEEVSKETESLEAQVEALKDKATNLEETNKTLNKSLQDATKKLNRQKNETVVDAAIARKACLLYTSPSPRDS